MKNKIYEILTDINKKCSGISENDDLFAKDILDSLSIAMLIAKIEDSFHIEVDAEDIIPENFTTINNITCMVNKYLG